MEENNGRLSIGIEVNTKQAEQQIESIVNELRNVSSAAEREGARLDSAFDLTSLREYGQMARDVFQDLAKNNDLTTLEGKIEALQTVIADNGEAAKGLQSDFESLAQEAQTAFESGNFDAFDEITIKMQETATSIGLINEETNRYKEVLAGLQPVQEQVGQTQEENSNIMVKMLGGQEKFDEVVSNLPQGLQGVIGSLKGMTGAAKAFIATPLGAILAAIVLALQSVRTWMNSTVEGQMALAKASGYLSGLLGQLKEIVITVGNALYKAFTNPREAIENFWNALKENVVNRIKAIGDLGTAMGKILKSAFTLDWEGVKEGVAEMGESFLQFGTGVDNLTQKVGDWARGVNEAAKATSDIAVAQKELDIEVSEWQKRKQELELIKAEARTKMYDTNLSETERQKALDTFKKALNEQYSTEEKFAQRRIELQERTMSLTSNTIEDENKLRDLQADKLALQVQKQNELAALQRRSNTITANANEQTQYNVEETAAKLAELYQELEKLGEKTKETGIIDMAALETLTNDITKLEEVIKKYRETISSNTLIPELPTRLPDTDLVLEPRSVEIVPNTVNTKGAFAASLRQFFSGISTEEWFDIGSNLVGTFTEIADAADNDKMKEYGESLMLIGQIGAKIATGDYLGAALTLITSVGQIIADDITSTRALQNALEDAYYSAAELRRQDMLEGFTSIFGDSSLQNLKQYVALIQELQKSLTNSTRNVKTMMFRVNDRFLVGDTQMSLEQFAHNTGMEMLDEYGNINADLIDAFLNAFEDIDDADRRFLENLKNKSADYAEAMKGVTDYLKELFGSVAETFAEQMIDSFDRTGEAAFELGDIIGSVARKMAKDWIESLLMEKVFNKYQQDYLDILNNTGTTDAEKQAAIMALFSQMSGQIDELTPLINEYLTGMSQFWGDDVTNSAKGIAQASQDSVDELNGRMTAVQGHTYAIAENTHMLVANTAEILQAVMHIRDNTDDLRNDLNTVKSAVQNIRTAITNIDTQGLRVR